MKINKEARAEQAVPATEEDLLAINDFTKRALTAEDVFTFSVLLCDNDVDRDFERFTIPALFKLEKLFLGKTGIFDHQWSAKEQKARIYRTVVKADESRSTAAGEPYTYLKAYAYMLRTDGNAEMIAEIEGGIKKEVSVGCSVADSKCSVCGENIGSLKCGHVRGREYDGRVCVAILSSPTDAYEWSFVAVPAQPNAGVIKKFGHSSGAATLAKYVEKSGRKAFSDEFEKISREAEMGRCYLKEVRNEIVRVGLMADCGMSSALLKSTAEKMDLDELLEMKEALERRVDKLMPPVTQLGGYKGDISYTPEPEFLI